MDILEELHLSNRECIVTDTIPGKNSQRILDLQKAKEASIVSYSRNMPIAIKRAKGSIIEDMDGNHFIDFFACAGVLNVGHCNPYVTARVHQQVDELIHILDFPTENKLEMIDNLLAQLPEDIRDNFKVAFTGPTGSDAVEAALKLAKLHTGRTGVIAFQGSYHGMTSGALSMTSNLGLRADLKAMLPDVTFIPYSYCYRCSFAQRRESCGIQCARYLEQLLENPHSGVQLPAAIIIEPIQGEGGVVIPADGFLERVIEIANKYGIVVIFDEIQAGFFRSGLFFASQHTNAVPHIYTMSKGIGGVGFPLAGLMYDKRIEAWASGKHIGTFRGNQVSLAAGNAAFDFIKKANLQQHVKEMEMLMHDRLVALSYNISTIGDVRGAGMFFGVEYVKDKTTCEPDAEIVKIIRNRCFKRGLLFEIGGHYNNVIRLLPPLVTTKTLVERALTIFEEVNHEVELEHAQEMVMVK
jgi:diaminobutyrate-2-oxoglutarate transaminase